MIEIFTAFQKKKHSNKSIWKKYKNYFLRLFFPNRAFPLLLKNEAQFQILCLKWLTEEFNNDKFKLASIPIYRACLKSYKEELTSRVGYLIPFGVLFATLIVIFSVLNKNELLVYQVTSFLIVILISIERINIASEASDASQFELLLELWESNFHKNILINTKGDDHE